MENYIVRIYRRDQGPESMTGIVEQVGMERQQVFHSVNDLIDILTGDQNGNSSRKKPRQRRERAE